MADLKAALESFLASEDFKSGVISSTKAGWGGSGYSVELFEDGRYRVLWDNEIGNLYRSPGVIMGLPKLDDEDLEEIEGWTEEEVQSEAFKLHVDEFEEDLRREVDFILEQREEAAKQNWGGKRTPAGGRPPSSDKVTIIRLWKSTERVYERYHGDTDIAVVIDGKCVRGHTNGATGSLYQSNGEPGWIGLSLEELKAIGFTFRFTNTVYHGVKSGKQYQQMDDGSWERFDDEGTTPVSGEVEIIER